MGRYLGSSCKLCRRDKKKLFLKGEKCISNCILDKGKRKNIPGQRSKKITKMTEYARHLREKQKAKHFVGLNEEQFRNYFRIAEKMSGLTGENLLFLLERRLDNTVIKMGFAQSRKFARQLIIHGHVKVKERVITAPGYLVKKGDKIFLNNKFNENRFVKSSLEKTLIPEWISVDRNTLSGTVLSLPTKEQFSCPVDSVLIVELYSK